MKHYIIVKFKPGFNYPEYIDDIKSIFNETISIKGIHSVCLKLSNSDRENRYDIMIEMSLEKSALTEYDNCAAHKLWKEKYGAFIDKKAIFDCEDECR